MPTSPAGTEPPCPVGWEGRPAGVQGSEDPEGHSRHLCSPVLWTHAPFHHPTRQSFLVPTLASTLTGRHCLSLTHVACRGQSEGTVATLRPLAAMAPPTRTAPRRGLAPSHASSDPQGVGRDRHLLPSQQRARAAPSRPTAPVGGKQGLGEAPASVPVPAVWWPHGTSGHRPQPRSLTRPGRG